MNYTILSFSLSLFLSLCVYTHLLYEPIQNIFSEY